MITKKISIPTEADMHLAELCIDMDRLYEAALTNNLKRIAEEMSWIEPAWVEARV